MNADLFWKTDATTPTENTTVSNQFGKRILSGYERHRNWLLHELCCCRARIRNGTSAKAERKMFQKELGKLRRAR